MGLDGADLLDDGDGAAAGATVGEGGGGEGKGSLAVSCSICLEVVSDNGDRSWAKLLCGHQFHLDCIGSAFNIKGAMQCPNCRKIEKGQWLFANSRQPPEFSMDDWGHDDDVYELSYSEMASKFSRYRSNYRVKKNWQSVGVHWCPFGGLTRLPSSFDEGEFSSTAYQELLGQHAIFAEHTAISSASHPCPYIAYFGPVPHSSSNSSATVSDGSSFNNHWNSASIPNEIPTYALPGMDVHYHSWDHHSAPFPTTSSRMVGADQPSIPSVAQRAARTNPDVSRSGSFMHPFIVGHSSAARAGSSVASSMIPTYPGSAARNRDRMQALQAYSQQPSNSSSLRTPVISGSRRSSSHRSVGQVGAVASSSDQPGGFYFFPSSSSGRSYQESETALPNRFHGWERDHLPSFQLNQMDRDMGWGAFHQVGGGGSDGILRSNSSFRQRHGSERMPSHNRS